MPISFALSRQNLHLIIGHLNFIQGAAKVSILMIGHQAIMDAYLCLLHLTAGILVGEHFIVLWLISLVVKKQQAC